MSQDSAASLEHPDALRIEHLDVAYRVGRGERRVLSDLSLAIRRGESYGLVGESGCGKSTAAFAAIRYLARNGRVSGGRILVDGRDLMALSPGELRRLRTQSVSMVYQDPGRALNPSLRIGRQMAEVFEAAEGLASAAALERAAHMLSRVQIASPERVLKSYPHELSGGMQQRVIIAMALSTHPALLILDEPTTGLDATVEAEVLELIGRLHVEFNNSILFISHNLPVVAHMCDRVGVLYAGELVEEGPAASVFRDPRHPYTVGLMRCVPAFGRRKDQGRLETIPGFPPSPGSIVGRCVFSDRCANATERCGREAPPLQDLDGRLSRCFYPERAQDLPHHSGAAEAPPQRAPGSGESARRPKLRRRARNRRAHPLLRTRNLSKTYQVSGKSFQAVHQVALDLDAGETLGLVGESGSGKSSLAKLLLGLSVPDGGSEIEFAGEALPARAQDRTAAQLKAMQIVFQNPGSALNRSQTVRRLIGRSLRLEGLYGRAREARLKELAASVRLTARHLDEKPRQLSGGLKQRVGIARAFAGGPRVVVCDEPTSALDVSVQSAILNLLVDLQRELKVSYVFISHDLNVVHYVSDRIAVLYLGRLLEIGPSESVFAGPHHPYTEALLSANPSLEDHALTRADKRIRLSGELPSALNLPSGCVFHTRCPRKLGEICERQEPPLHPAGEGHAIRCHIPAAELARLQAPRSPQTTV